MVKESKEAHQLIEEFMLLANRYVAGKRREEKLKDKMVPFPTGSNDDPDEEKLVPFVAFARNLGTSLISSPEAIAASFNQLLQDAHGKPEQHVLEQLGIRTMAKAKYTTENVGHYGLGFEHYCHLRLPIRRCRISWRTDSQEVLDDQVQPDKNWRNASTAANRNGRDGSGTGRQ